MQSLLTIPVPLVLASQSPRRRTLMRQVGLECHVVPSNVDEEAIHDLTLHPEHYVQQLALLKAQDVAKQVIEDSIVIGADTTVVLNNTILNKPATPDEAFTMLRMLSNNTHSVFTGIAVVRGETHRTAVKETRVTFRQLEDDEIRAYIATGSPMDKAGSYGIQDDFGAVFVRHIEGCYYNIVGLPLELLYQTLKEFVKS